MDKHFVFRHYWWIAATLAAVAIGLIILAVPSGRAALFASTLGAAAGFCYFAQKQKLEELRLFKDLFTDFNRRYEDLNDSLEDIRAKNAPSDDARNHKTLVKYFNLCAEEYLFFAEGYIHPSAWTSWCRGMQYYLKCEWIRRAWDKEVSLESYYGLTVEKIEEGATLICRSRRRPRAGRA